MKRSRYVNHGHPALLSELNDVTKSHNSHHQLGCIAHISRVGFLFCRSFEPARRKMDRSSTDEQPLHSYCIPSENQEQKLGAVQDAGKQAQSSPAQNIRHGSAGTNRSDADHADARPTHSNRAETHLPEEYHAQGSDSNIFGPVLWSLDYAQQVKTSEQAHEASSLMPSTNTQTDHSDISADITLLPSNPDMVSSNPAPQYSPPLQVLESLGLEGCAGIIGGSIGLLGVFIFLAFLWFGGECQLSSIWVYYSSFSKSSQAGSAPEAANATWVWRQLAMRNWMPRVVTLTSIILRFIIGTQAKICTSMIAALLLERLAVPRSQVARASVMRGINDGPLMLIMMMLSSKSNTSSILCHLEAWLILLVALLTLALQFTSTILLSDMRTFQMIGDLNITTFNGLFTYPGKEKFSLVEGLVITSAPVYPIFGETFTMHDSTPNSRGLSDTGLTQRGLLPMSNRDHRTSIREYDGMGMVMSSRVACMRPVITNASLDFASETDGFWQLQGVLHYSQSLREAHPGTGPLCSVSENCEKLSFECLMPDPEEDAWATEACILDGVGGYFRGSNQSMWDPADVPWSENSSIWLVYSTSMRSDLWGSMPPSLSMQSAQPSADNEWIMYEIVPDYFIKVAVCFSDFDFAYRDIRMRTAEATTEPSTNLSMVAHEKFSLDKVQTYLGLDRSRQSVAERGILSLEVKPDEGTPYTRPPSHYDLLNQPADNITPDALTASSIRLAIGYELCNGGSKNTAFGLCTHCYTDTRILPHMEYAHLFSNMILGTPLTSGRAADALHAFISVAGLNVYNRFLATSMNVPQQARVVTTREVTVPGSWPPSTASCAGLIAVASLLAAYLSLVAVTTVLYIRHTRYSRYGNVWHVISQLVDSEELGEALKFGNNASDKAVKVDLRTKGSFKEDVLVKLGKTDGCENIKVKRSGS